MWEGSCLFSPRVCWTGCVWGGTAFPKVCFPRWCRGTLGRGFLRRPWGGRERQAWRPQREDGVRSLPPRVPSLS